MEQIMGIFLSLNKEEMETINHELKIRGYDQNATGLKECIIDIFSEKEEEKPDENILSQILDYSIQNPELIDGFKNIALGFAQKLKRR